MTDTMNGADTKITAPTAPVLDDALDDAAAPLRARLSALTAKHDQLSARITEADQLRARAERAITKARADIEQAKTARSDAEVELRAMRDDMLRTTNALDALNAAKPRPVRKAAR